MCVHKHDIVKASRGPALGLRWLAGEALSDDHYQISPQPGTFSVETHFNG